MERMEMKLPSLLQANCCHLVSMDDSIYRINFLMLFFYLTQVDHMRMMMINILSKVARHIYISDEFKKWYRK